MEKEAVLTSQTKSTQKWILTLGIVFIALNLRPAITSVGPLISSIRADFGLSNGLAGLLTTLPLLAFAALSPLALSRLRWGIAWEMNARCSSV